jgi:hypothetical protein
MGLCGYQTTIGTAEYHEMVMNKIDFESLALVKGKRGRPSIVSSYIFAI